MKKFMQKVTKSFHAGEKGFTLIELLIVIVILGVLAVAARTGNRSRTIMLPRLMGWFGLE